MDHRGIARCYINANEIQIARAAHVRKYNYILIKPGTKIYSYLDPRPTKIENQIQYKILYI
jgi:hypothetical protein